MVTMTRSTPRTASGTETAVAPVSAARPESVSGPRELATKTSCPKSVRRRVSVPPIWPAPIMPTFIALDPYQGSVGMAGRYTGSYLDRPNGWRAVATLAPQHLRPGASVRLMGLGGHRLAQTITTRISVPLVTSQDASCGPGPTGIDIVSAGTPGTDHNLIGFA